MNKKNVITGVGGGVLLLLLVVLVSAGIMKKAKANLVAEAEYALQEVPRSVMLETVVASESHPSHGYPGMVRASQESELSFRVSGPLISENVELGRPVKKGDLLMQIDPRDFEDRIASLEAQLSGA